MVLKYYAEVDNLELAVNYYESLFKAVIIKNGINARHASLKLFGQISLLLHVNHQSSVKPGYHIIKFDDDEVGLFYEAIKIVENNNKAMIEFPLTKGGWGNTSFFQFRDIYGHHWVYEINTSAI